MPVDTDTVREIVQKVLDRLEMSAPAGPVRVDPPRSGEATPLQLPKGLSGAFNSIESAVAAASSAFAEYSRLPLELRRGIISAIRARCLSQNERWSRMAVEETGLGRADHKLIKNLLAIERTPGVEDLAPEAVSGDHGLTLTELAPWGVIGSITPSTNPVATVINNTISMLSAGNAVVFNPHPGAAGVAVDCICQLNAAIVSAGGPPNLVATVTAPSVATAEELMRHPSVALLAVTGGPAVVRAAFASGKKVVAAGPGNPPVVVDDTADICRAARSIVEGASFDNNIVCVDEKEIICVDSVTDDLKSALVHWGAFELAPNDWRRLAQSVLTRREGAGCGGAPGKTYVGKDASLLLAAIGMEGAGNAPDGSPPRMLFADVPPDDPFVSTEQLMPAIPLVRARDADEAIELARRVEGGRRHTAVIHSKNIERLSKMARAMDCTLFVKNGPAYAGLGAGGEGHASFTIASPTGEGLTSARTFTRRRRCVLVDYFRIV